MVDTNLRRHQDCVIGCLHVLVEQQVQEVVVVRLLDIFTMMTVRPQCNAQQSTTTKEGGGKRGERVEEIEGVRRLDW